MPQRPIYFGTEEKESNEMKATIRIRHRHFKKSALQQFRTEKKTMIHIQNAAGALLYAATL
jgi:hypothetical protein